METSEFNFSEYHRQFTNNTVNYYKQQSTFVDKMNLCVETDNRAKLLMSLNELLHSISEHPYCLINAFRNSITANAQPASVKDLEIEFFTDVISSLFELLSHKHDLQKWIHQLSSEKKQLEGVP